MEREYRYSTINIKQNLLQINFLTTCTIFLLLLVHLSSCEKIIEVDLNDADSTIVIEGNLSKKHGDLEVKISRTGSYFDAAPLEKIENAEVVLSGGPGYKININSNGNGLYRVSNLPLQTGITYRLDVNLEGEEYSAFSTLYPKVRIDSLSYEYQSEEPFIKGGYRLLLYIKDPPDVANYYRVNIYKNGFPIDSSSDIIIFDDTRLDGKGIRVRLGTHAFEKGDTARVELQVIDKNVWEYFRGLREVTNLNPGSPAPANPVSNFSNGALGYFSASSSSEREIIIR